MDPTQITQTGDKDPLQGDQQRENIKVLIGMPAVNLF